MASLPQTRRTLSIRCLASGLDVFLRSNCVSKDSTKAQCIACGKHHSHIQPCSRASLWKAFLHSEPASEVAPLTCLGSTPYHLRTVSTYSINHSDACLSSFLGGAYKVTASNAVFNSGPDFQKMRTTRNFWWLTLLVQRSALRCTSVKTLRLRTGRRATFTCSAGTRKHSSIVPRIVSRQQATQSLAGCSLFLLSASAFRCANVT